VRYPGDFYGLDSLGSWNISHMSVPKVRDNISNKKKMWHCMFFPSLGNHLSRESTLEKISQTGREFGMIASKKRLGRSLKETSREVVMRTWPLSVRQGSAKKRFLARRVTMMEDHYS
jgi:hypothetical protein